MIETAKLIISVDSRGAKGATRDLAELERAASATGREANKLGAAIGRFLGGALTSGAVALATKQYITLADTWANMTARMRMATNSAAEYHRAQAAVSQIANETATDLEGVADLYTKLANSSDALRGNQELLIGVTENVSKAISLSGADAGTAAAVIRQFSQAMAAGRLSGDELNTVLEGSSRLARAIADGMNEPIGKLKEMAAQGQLTSEKVVDALKSQSQKLDEEYSRMPLTVGKAVQQIRNSLLELVGGTDEAQGATANLASELSELASSLKSDGMKSGFSSFIGFVGNMITVVRAGAAHVANLGRVIGDTAGLMMAFHDNVTGLAKNAGGNIARVWNGGSLTDAIRNQWGAVQRASGNIREAGGRWAENQHAGMVRLHDILAGNDKPPRTATGGSAGGASATGSGSAGAGRGAAGRAGRGGGGGGESARNEFAEWQRQMQQSITLQEALAVAYGKGEGAVAAANRAHEAEMQTLKLGASRRAEIITLIEREAQAKANAGAAQAIAGMEREIYFLGKTAEGHREITHAMRAEYAVAMGEYASASDEVKRQLIERAVAQDRAAESAERMTRAISAREEAERLLADMRFEVSLLGLGNLEREKAIALRRLDTNATAEQRAELDRLVEALNAKKDGMTVFAEQAARNIQSLLGDGLHAVLDGKFSSIGESFSKMLKGMMAELAASKILDMLAGAATGYEGTGKFGGFIRSLGGFLKGSRAMGGPVASGGLYEVGEGGRPELFEQGGRMFLIPGNQGRVIPAKAGGIGGGAAALRITVNIHNATQVADVQQRQGADGGMDVDVIFRQFEGRMAAGLADGTSPLGGALKGRYGLREVV